MPSAPPVAGAEPSTPPGPTYTWEYDSSTDEMTGQVTRYAAVFSENTHQLEFPYQGGTKALLRIKKHPRNGLLVTVGINKGQLTCHSFMNCKILVRFDDRPPIKFRATEPADHSTDMLFLMPEKQFLKEVKKSTRVAVELPFFQAGNLIFQFNTVDLKWE